MIHCIDSKGHNNSVIIMIHGAACNSEVWMEQYDYLTNSHRVVLIDLPGHNKSDGDGFDSIDRYVDALYLRVKEMDLNRFVLCGHSMGGAITQLFALKHPEILKGIILCSTGARLRVTHQVFEAIEKDFNLFVDMSLLFSVAQEASDEIKKRFKNIINKCRPVVAMNDFRACNSFDLMSRIQELKLPTLIICGDSDLLTPLKYSEYLNNKIENSELEILESCGHMIMLERPDIVNVCINNFLLKL